MDTAEITSRKGHTAQLSSWRRRFVSYTRSRSSPTLKALAAPLVRMLIIYAFNTRQFVVQAHLGDISTNAELSHVAFHGASQSCGERRILEYGLNPVINGLTNRILDTCASPSYARPEFVGEQEDIDRVSCQLKQPLNIRQRMEPMNVHRRPSLALWHNANELRNRNFSRKAVKSSETRTPVASKTRTDNRLSGFICAFISTANSSALSINRFFISGRFPMMASSWIPAHGLAKISLLPVACLKIPRRTHQRVKRSTQPAFTRSICAITSAGPTD